MDLKNFASAIAQIGEEKGIPAEKVIESIAQALAAAYKKDYGEKGQVIKAELDQKTGEVKFWQIKTVVDESMIYSEQELEQLKDEKIDIEKEGEDKGKVRFNSEKHIMLDDAKKKKPKIKVGDEFVVQLKTQKDYGRIAAQTAKQVIMQRIREAEKETIFEEYKSKEDQIVSGIVQRIEGRNIFFDIGKTLGILPKEEQVRGEFYRPGQRLKVYILKVEETPKGPVILLSRAYPKLVSKLFELEVPEIAAGTVAIKSIAREAGSRTKISVASSEEEIDPIGAAVGQRGTRVQVIINELGGEKIDIIEHSDDPQKYISNALSPAKVLDVKIMPKNKALAIVPEDQLSLAIGKDGQNVRLAAKLTGWKIDVRSSESDETEWSSEQERESEQDDKKEKEGEKKTKKEKKSSHTKTKAKTKAKQSNEKKVKDKKED
jgi:N utilization substance protein A